MVRLIAEVLREMVHGEVIQAKAKPEELISFDHYLCPAAQIRTVSPLPCAEAAALSNRTSLGISNKEACCRESVSLSHPALPATRSSARRLLTTYYRYRLLLTTHYLLQPQNVLQDGGADRSQL